MTIEQDLLREQIISLLSSLSTINGITESFLDELRASSGIDVFLLCTEHGFSYRSSHDEHAEYMQEYHPGDPHPNDDLPF